MNKKNNELIIHIILFVFTAGIGNIIYLVAKYGSKTKNNNYRYFPDCQNLIDQNALIAFRRDAELRKQTNRNLVKITTHGGSCDNCKRWEGQILVDDVFMTARGNYNYNYLSNAIRSGLFHKGCRHGMTTYYPELKGRKYNKAEKNNLSFDVKSKSRNTVLVDVDTGEVIEQ